MKLHSRKRILSQRNKLDKKVIFRSAIFATCCTMEARKIIANAFETKKSIYPSVARVSGVHAGPEPEEVHDLGDGRVLVAAALGQRRHDVLVVHLVLVLVLLGLLADPSEDFVRPRPFAIVDGRGGHFGGATPLAAPQKPQKVLAYAPPKGRL